MPASTRDIRRRIKSIKNTAQITKAMQMVASSKMRKAQQTALAGRPFEERMNKVIVSLRDRVDLGSHGLLEEREVERELVLIITTDKGLCGALNTNLLREVGKLDASKTDFVTAGRKGKQYLSRLKRNILADFELPDSPTFKDTKVVSSFCIEQFLSGNVDKVTVAFTYFVNTLNQKPVLRPLLPLTPYELENVEGDEAKRDGEAAAGKEYLFEPSASEVLGAILPYYIHFQIYEMALNARASEHSARMVAMKSATDNANELVKDLTLEYNKIRQAAITTELLEITTAQMALG
jgi:F-type H+-transporting ATPase subunit gamma